MESLFQMRERTTTDGRSVVGRRLQSKLQSRGDGSIKQRQTHGSAAAVAPLVLSAGRAAAGFRHRCTRCRPVRLRFWRARRKRGARAHTGQQLPLCTAVAAAAACLPSNSLPFSFGTHSTGGHCICSFPQQGTLNTTTSKLRLRLRRRRRRRCGSSRCSCSGHVKSALMPACRGPRPPPRMIWAPWQDMHAVALMTRLQWGSLFAFFVGCHSGWALHCHRTRMSLYW